MYNKDLICTSHKKELAFAWESCRVPLEEIAELVLDQMAYINQLKARINKLDKITFEDEFLEK